MTEPYQEPRLDMYAQDLLRQSYQTNPISSDVLTRFGQGMADQVRQSVQPPPQAVQQYSGMQPPPGRVQYLDMINQRFNQLAQAAGGEQELIDTGIYDQVRQKAMKDVEMLYGGPPPIEQETPLQQYETGGRQFARGGIFGKQVTEVTPAEPKKEAPSEAKSVLIKGASEYVNKIQQLLGPFETAIQQVEDPTKSVQQRLSNARTLGKLINSIQVGSPDAVGAEEAKMLMDELDEKVFNPKGLFTSQQVIGTNLPQFIEKLKDIRNRVAGQYNSARDMVVNFDPTLSEALPVRELYQPTPQQGGQAPQGATQGAQRRIFVPGKGFQ